MLRTHALFEASADEEVYVAGTPIGISIKAGGLIVEDAGGVMTKSGNVYPLDGTGIKKGDIITSLDGEKMNSIYRFKSLVEKSDGKVKLAITSDGKSREVEVTPAVDGAGQKRLGLTLKEYVGGVGTLTFVTENGKFAALGHYIADADTGLSDELQSGEIYKTTIEDVIKGEKGKAGGLVAEVNRLSKPIGKIEKNTLIGLYGDYNIAPAGELYRVARKGEAKMGAAKLLTTIDDGDPQMYDIDIVKVISQSEPTEKGMVIAVKDKRLLQKTGGIVQGMSGSPIIQNGLFIGAVTHVFVQDPTRGYAVHGRFMLAGADALSQTDGRNMLAA